MNRYLEQKILTAEPIELVGILYQATTSSVRDARTHLREGRIAQRASAINLAWAAVAELNGSLDMEAAPELAGRLRSLYFHIQNRLVKANTEQSDEPLAEVLGLLTTLAEGWTAVAEAQRADNRKFAVSQPAPGHGDSVALSL